MNLHLTFDDGPSEWTPQILDLLAEHDVKATFFVIGQHLTAERSELMRRIVGEGHTVGNHTWSHPRLTDLHENQVVSELTRTSNRILYTTGYSPTLWRAPSYRTDARIDLLARSLGLTHVGVDISPDDWMLTDPAEISQRVLHAASGTGDGRKVLTLHDGIPPDGGSERCTASRQPTVDGLRLILEAIK